jgi:hypothetical protein
MALPDRNSDKTCKKQHLKQIQTRNDDLTRSGPNGTKYTEQPMPQDTMRGNQTGLSNEQHDPPSHRP